MDTMTNWEIRRYCAGDAGLWNRLADASRNGTFLHRREYMDYHADRFDDCSLIALRRGKPMALLPADLTVDGVLRSHGGLSYGGWLLPPGHVDGDEVMELFEAMTEWCRDCGVKSIDYRPVPVIYHRQPCQEDVYALFRLGARLIGCGLSATIDYSDREPFSTMRRRHLRKTEGIDYQIAEETDVAPFHAMLADCLAERHGAVPVHTAAELQLLHDRFPDRIRIFTLRVDGRLMAGVTMYLTDTVAHSQYIATTSEGRSLNLLTPLFANLIDRYSVSHRYFDFGISTEEGGRILNAGLLRQKFSFGGSGTVTQRFMIDL